MNTHEEFITLETATGHIYGTITHPTGDEYEKIALIIADSGPTDRDGNSPMLAGKNDCLKMLAEALAEQGIASVRYDKRGVAESLSAGPHEIDLRIEHYIQDTVEWTQMLTRDYGYAQVSLIGHGEGALISALAAQQYPVKSLISIAGTSEKASAVLRRQLYGHLPADLVQANESILSVLESGILVEDIPPALDILYRRSIQPYMISWFHYSPTQEYSQLSIPCCIIQGDSDMQIPVDDSFELLNASSRAELKIIAGMNHVMKSVPQSISKQMASYRDPSLPIMHEAITAMTSFLLR